MTLRFLSLGLVGAFALAGCAGATYDSTIKDLQQAPRSGSAFDNALADEYQGLAEFEGYKMYDYTDSIYFAQKGLSAAAGKTPLPQPVSERNLTADHVGELTTAHDTLAKALDGGARASMPAKAARAQAMYDCWIEQQEENFQKDDIAACKGKFDLAMKDLKVEAPKPVAAEPPAPARVLIFFEFDKYNLPEGASQFLDRAMEAYGQRHPSTVDVTGHADRSGTDAYNMKLSEKRADTVSAALQKRGVPASTINESWKGESEPLVQTPDGERNMSNRRVEIVIP